MRLIDMWGASDIPYEQAALIIDEGCILAQFPNGSKYLMAEYSDIETAKKVMRNLHIAYSKSSEDPISKTYLGKMSECFYFPAEEEI
jgi:hypothetical protein